MTILYNGNPDDLLTYTSPSPKLCMGPSGTYRYGPHNLYVNSASPANQSITLVSGAAYTIVITGSVSVTASGAATGTWTAGTTDFTAATGTLTLGSTSGAGTVHVRRTNSDTTYLQTGATARYGLPFEWSAAGALQGILVEEARTNLLVYSRQLDNAAWIKSNATVSADVRADIFGGTGADAIVENATNSSHSVYQTITTSAVAYAVSVIVEAGAQSYAYVALYDVVDTHGYYYDLATGAVGSATGTASGGAITNLGGGRYHVSFTVTPAANAGSRFAIYSATGTTAGSRTYLGTSATAIYVHHAQLETGAFATSPIETFGATVTRAADNISLATTAFPNVDSNLTLYAKFVMLGSAAIDRRVVQLAGASDTTDMFVSSAGNLTGLADSLSMGSVAGTTTLGSAYKAAAGYTSGAQSITRSGLTPATSIGAMSTAYTTLRLGNTAGTAQFLSGYLQQIMVLSRKMSDAELQALTT